MNLDFLKIENIGGEFQKIKNSLSTDGYFRPRVSVNKLTDGAKHHITSFLDGLRLFVVSDKLAARNAVERLNGVVKNSAVYLSERDDSLLNVKNISRESMSERLNALLTLAKGEPKVVVVTAEGLMQKYPSPALFSSMCLKISKEGIIEPQNLTKLLSKSGYQRVDTVSERGEFALRGDILDVFSEGADKPVRISFFDDLIESIKEFEPESMASINELDEIVLPPASDILIDEKSLIALSKRDLKGIPLQAQILMRELNEKAAVGACPPELSWLRPFIPSMNFSVLDYLRDATVIFDEPKVVFEKLELCKKEHESRVKSLLEAGEIAPEHKEGIYYPEQIFKRLDAFKLMSLSSLTLSNPIFKPSFTFSPVCRPVTKYFLDNAALVQDIRTFLMNGFKIVLSTRSEEEAKSLFRSLVDSEAAVTLKGEPEFTKAIILPCGVEHGFLYPEQKLIVIGASELLGKKRDISRILPKRHFIELKQGDYVVHSVHGVGICEGTARMKIGDFEKEFVVLRYENNDILYVTIDQMDSLTKFIGEQNPPLNKLGGKDFLREKEKVKKSIRKIAINLLELYAERQRQRGHIYSEDDSFQKEFEENFPYDETPDQISAIKAIKEEMMAGKVIDRLICGDVGFGKTEVAFRIMFKTILENRQAVLLAPTTILCKQHFELLSERLKPFGIECGMLSRMQTDAENKDTLKRLQDGTLLVAVATHRILSKDVVFSNIGLLVLDEEQRFGVEHKERLKQKYPDINVLTLSATPIPRTLNMALSGVRDISMLETAPKGRLPVQTYVVEYSDALIADAINRETARGGQVLLLYNSVEHIVTFKRQLQSKLPDHIRVVYAHGQMSPSELEKNMTDFYEKKYDVLIATTIIENGIDLPDANTLIVIDSEKFGLSQLYQLRGRVGRRGALAHAYLTIPNEAAMSETAQKRLAALMEYTEIGSGFKISVADLSIRGAGTLMGAEQHGHIERVGYEMYIEILNKTVEELKTGKSQDEREIEFKVDASAFIRNNYVSARDKLRIYKRISEISTIAERKQLEKELEEIYGLVDEPLRNLMGISLIKNLARGLEVKSVIVNQKGVGVNFHSDSVFKNRELMNAVAEHPKDIVLTSTIPPSLIFRSDNMTPEHKINIIADFFSEVAMK